MSKAEQSTAAASVPLSQVGASVKDIAGVLQQHLQVLPVAIPHPEKSGELIPAFSLPAGSNSLKVEDFKSIQDKYRSKPERRSGTAVLLDLDSFIAHANRFKDEHSALFAINDMEKPSITAVLDYHEKAANGSPRFGQHRGLYKFPLSKQWKIWFKNDGEIMSQADFAAFLENNIIDVLPPPDWMHVEFDAKDPNRNEADQKLADLMKLHEGTIAGPNKLRALSRGLEINVDSRVHNAQNLSSGEITVQWEEQHRDGAGEPIKVPNWFLIGIPIFEMGAMYRLAVRLRYRAGGGKIAWFYQIHRPDLAFEHAFDEAVKKAAAETELPLMLGTPE